MKNHGRTTTPFLSPFLGVLACALSFAPVSIAGAATREREARLEAPAQPKAPQGAVAETTTAQRDEAPGCRRLPSGRPIVKLNLKPETDIVDLTAWISSITCRQFLVPGTVLANTKKVTVYAPQLITPEGAYQLFLSALDSVGLTVQESGRFLRIIETAKAKSTAVPLYGFAGQRLSDAPDQK